MNKVIKFYWSGHEGYCHNCLQDGGGIISKGLMEEKKNDGIELIEATDQSDPDVEYSVDYCCNCDLINPLHEVTSK